MEAEQGKDGLCFVTVGGLRVFSPAASRHDCPKKHACADCHFCQFCSDSRCQTCRSDKGRTSRRSADKLSLTDQVLHYEQINASNRNA